MNPQIDEITELANRVKQSRIWQRNGKPAKAKLAKLFDRYLAKTPGALEGNDIPGALDVHRLNGHLGECFEKDYSLWPGQKRLFAGHKGTRLEIGALSEILDPTEIFWFWQALRFSMNEAKATQSIIVYSEPLFFFSNSLRAYLRFLDIDHDGKFDIKSIERVNTLVRSRILKTIPKLQSPASKTETIIQDGVTKRMDSLIGALDLVPARSYIPAGEVKASVDIRAWFRSRHDRAPEFKDVRELAIDDYNRANLVVLASRSGHPILKRFQEDVNGLKIRLTEKGITFFDQLMEDRTDDDGFCRAHVVVTNWVLEAQNVHTYIASNHTRALGEVAHLLLKDDLLKPLSGLLLRRDEQSPHRKGEIHSRFQLAFTVDLKLNQLHAMEPVLLPELKKGPITYNEAGIVEKFPLDA